MTDDDWMTPPPIPNEELEDGSDSVLETMVEDDRTADLEEPTNMSYMGPGNEGVDVKEAISEVEESGEDEGAVNEESSAQQAGCKPYTKHALGMQKALEKLDCVDLKVDELVQLFLQKIARTDYEVASLQRQTDEIERYRAGVYDQIMTPLLLSMVEVSDKMARTISFAQSKERPDDVIGVQDLVVYKGMIDNMLETNGVREYEPTVGDQFECSRARVLSRVLTGNRALHQTIAEVLSKGYELNGRAVLPATVRVYGYKAGYEDVELQESMQSHEQVSSRKEQKTC